MSTAKKDLLPVIQKETVKMEVELISLDIKDEMSFMQASDIVKKAKDRYKELDAEKKEFTKPANEILSAAKAKYDPVLNFLKNVEARVKGKAQVYLEAKLKAANAEAAKIADRVERGTMREDTGMRKLDEVDTSKSVRTESSGMRMVERKGVKADELTRLDGADLVQLAKDGYIVWDMVKVRKDVLAGAEVVGAYITKEQSMQSI